MRLLALFLLLASPSCTAQRKAPDVYRSAVVLFFSPDSLDIERLKREHGETDFYAIADDAMWYQDGAFTLLDSLGVAYTTAKRSPVRFEVDGDVHTYTWEDVESGWFAVVYDGATAPRVVHSIDLPEEFAGERP